MATKEEIEGELKELRYRHEQLKLQKKEAETKLELAHKIITEVNKFLDMVPDVSYNELGEGIHEAIKHNPERDQI